MDIGRGAIHVLTGTHGHDPVNVFKGVCHFGAKRDISYSGFMNFTGQSVPGVRSCSCSTVVTICALDLHGSFALAVKDSPTLGGCHKAFIHDVFGYFYDLSFAPCAGAF